MKKHMFLFCILILILVVAAPVLAATVTCPSSCSCLLPDEAKKIAAPGYCQGKQAVCGNDTQKNEKYCYEKPVTTTVIPKLIISAKPLITTTPTEVPLEKCAAGCTCLSTADGKAKGLLYCSVRQTLCGYNADKTPLYCFALPSTTTTVPTLVTGLRVISTTTTQPVILEKTEPCTTGCSCLAVEKVNAAEFKKCSGTTKPCDYDALGRPMYCYIADRETRVNPLLTTTPATLVPFGGGAVPLNEPIAGGAPSPAPSGNIIGMINGFFASLFGSPPASSSASRTVNCKGVLSNVMVDPANCGSCGTVCPSGKCTMGTCSDESGRVFSCGPLAIQCNGTCTYTRTDDENCGSCDTRCQSREGCCDGICTNLWTAENCGTCGNACGANQNCCNRKCVDMSVDRLNCGECNHRCPEGYSCSFGGCIDTTDDELNCGGRGMRCAYDEVCCDSHCVNTAADINNCGACGQTCTGTSVCYNGECVDTTSDEYHCGDRETECTLRETCCNSRCVNLAQDDDNNCGGCGNTCGEEFTCCSGTCEHLSSDENNCGICGNICGPDEQCCDGTCISLWLQSHCGSCHNSCGACESCNGRSCETTFFSVIDCITPG